MLQNQQFGLNNKINAVSKAKKLLSDSLIKNVKLLKNTSDLTIIFSSGIILEIITISSGYESWQLYTPSGISFYAKNNQICQWK